MTTVHQSILNKSRADKFLMVITLPPVLKSINHKLLTELTKDSIQRDALQYSIWGTVVPAVNIPSIPIKWSGQTYNVTSQTRNEYAPITVNFTIDNEFKNYWVLWTWLNKLNDARNSGMAKELSEPIVTPNPYDENFTDYQTTMTVYGRNEYNEERVKFTYYNAFITELGDITYNYRTENELESRFTFAFGQLDVALLNNGQPIF